MRFLLVLAAILGGVYAYLASRLASGVIPAAALAIPLVLIGIVPALYWGGRRKRNTVFDELLHIASYLCMGWLSFALVLSLARDFALLATGWDAGRAAVLGGSVLALFAGAAAAFAGPRIRRVDIRVEGLAPALEGLRIVQITDLHVGPTIGERYVRRVVRMANELRADIVAVTGDIVDGPVSRLARHVAALGELQPAGRVFYVPGNHEYYAGISQWLEHFRLLGFRALLNEHVVVAFKGAQVLIGGVTDPAAGPAQPPQPERANDARVDAAFRLLLAHNPKLAPAAEKAGFDLQLSGHTHAGQFFPWTLAVRLVHAPHVAGLSRSGRTQVYVSAGTGTWGPPVRFGTQPELTLLRLVAN